MIKAVKNVRLSAWSWWPQAADHRGGNGKVGMGRLTQVAFPSLGERWVCVIDTPCGENSPLSMKWLSICSAYGAPINAGGIHGKSSEREAKSNCDSEMSNLPHNVKAVLGAVYSSCSTLKWKLFKNDPVVQSPGPIALHKHCRFVFLLHIFWDVRGTGLQRVYTVV